MLLNLWIASEYEAFGRVCSTPKKGASSFHGVFDMFWNKETPTVPGLYWFKADDYDVTIVELTVTGDMIINYFI